jgi:2-phospho-L-lactate guanylyltransferase
MSSLPLWSVILPVKLLADAKSRLHVDHGRAELALAFFTDVLDASRMAPSVGEIHVVSDDPAAQAVVQEAADDRVRIVEQGPVAGLNPAIRHAASRIPSSTPVAVIASDLPCLDAATVTMVLAQAAHHERAFVTDAQGIGTTMLFRTAGPSLDPAFGGRSRARHRQLGYVELAESQQRESKEREHEEREPKDTEHWARARRDVDTAVDLWDAQRIGVGQATAAILLGSTNTPTSRHLLLTAGTAGPSGDVAAVTEDGTRMVIPSAVLDASPFRHLRPGQRVLASVRGDLVTAIALSGQ